MELSPGLSEVVFGLRAEVEALKARLTQIERGTRLQSPRLTGRRLSESAIRARKRNVSCSEGDKNWDPLPRVPTLDASFSRLSENT